MDFDALIRDEQDRLTRRLARVLGGDRELAEDVRQETLLRAWRALPRELEAVEQRAWLRRVATNLAIDELRRRVRRPTAPLADATDVSTGVVETNDAAREALSRLSAHERFVLLLRFEAGFAHGEIAGLLGISEEAARKRVARARKAFLAVYRQARAGSRPLILVRTNDDRDVYIRWLERSGAEVRQCLTAPTERDLALADGLVLSGAFDDVHSATYGEAPRALRGEPDLARDRADLAVIAGAMALDLPFVGVCRGHQLLNVACGGSLYQDVLGDGATQRDHDTGQHRVRTQSSSVLRGRLGVQALVHSEHHQAVARLGRGLRPAAEAPDGLVEAIERADRAFVIGVQWHPETDPEGAGGRIADALLDAALARAA